MHLPFELRRRAKHAVFPILSACAISYFGYHAVHGQYGLLAYMRLQQQIAALNAEYRDLAAQRQRLEHRATLLKSESLDPDMLEERAQALVGYAHPNDAVILDVK